MVATEGSIYKISLKRIRLSTSTTVATMGSTTLCLVVPYQTFRIGCSIYRRRYHELNNLVPSCALPSYCLEALDLIYWL